MEMQASGATLPQKQISGRKGRGGGSVISRRRGSVIRRRESEEEGDYLQLSPPSYFTFSLALPHPSAPGNMEPLTPLHGCRDVVVQHDVPWVPGSNSPEDGYFIGLDNLITLFSQCLVSAPSSKQVVRSALV